VEQLGFHFSDIKILLISHAHADHDAGSAEVKRLTGAKYMVMDGDVPVVESGGAKDFHYPKTSIQRSRWIVCCTMAMRCGWAVRCWSRIRRQGTRAAVRPGRCERRGRPTSRCGDRRQLEREPGIPVGRPAGATRFLSRHRCRLSARTFVILKGPALRCLPGAHGQYFDMLKRSSRGVELEIAGAER
jgi:hypothetical protein